MLDFWLKLKLWTEYIVPAAIVALLIISVVLYIAFNSFRYSCREKLLKKNGFKRYRKSIGVCNGYVSKPDTYAWKNKETGKDFEERDLMRWSCKHIRKIIKENSGDSKE